MMSITRTDFESWLENLKVAWESGDPERALHLFEQTEEYYERPWKPGTSMADYKVYWQDIDGLEEITFDYEIIAVDGNTGCARWQNSFIPPEGDYTLLDGVFIVEFNEDGYCRVFRQYWFMK